MATQAVTAGSLAAVCGGLSGAARPRAGVGCRYGVPVPLRKQVISTRSFSIRAQSSSEGQPLHTETQGSVLVVSSEGQVLSEGQEQGPAVDTVEERGLAEDKAEVQGPAEAKAVWEEEKEETDTKPEEEEDPERKYEVAKLKIALLAAVAGLDRGKAAGSLERRMVENAALELEAAGPRLSYPSDLLRSEGRWRLLYTTGFSSGSLGGTRPGPSLGRLPFELGSVYQQIDTLKQQLDNVVMLRGQAVWPFPPLELTATLQHTFRVTGRNEIEITFTDTKIQAGGPLGQLPEIGLPSLPEFLRPPGNLRSSKFNTTYADDEIRITRGDRGELRIFAKAGYK